MIRSIASNSGIINNHFIFPECILSMARISQQEKEKKYAELADAILMLFLEKGWHCLTYDNLALATGVKKSTLQGYYPIKNDFFTAIEGRILPILIGELNFTSKVALQNSWMKALKTAPFCHVIQFFLHHCVEVHNSDYAKKGFSNFTLYVESRLSKEESEYIIEQLLGMSLIYFMKQKNKTYL